MLKKKSKRERERLARLARKKLAREKRLRRKEVLRDWLREWPCDDLPVVPALNKLKRDPTAHHCSDEVTAVVRRVLGRSCKPKIKKTKDSEKERQLKRDQAEKMRIILKKQESSGSRWSGSRNTTHEDRPGKAKQEKARKVKQQKEEKAKKQKEKKVKQEEEIKAVQEKERKKKLKTVQESKNREEPAVSSAKSPVETAQPTFSELTDFKSTADDHLQTPYHLRFEAKIKANIEAKKVWREEPDLTDESDDEDAAELTDDSGDEQDGARSPTFSEFYYSSYPQNSTQFSSTVKSSVTKDKEISRSTIEHPASSSRPNVFGDLEGGGSPSQETSQSYLDISAMLEALKLAIGRTGLPLKLDKRTPAEGNCFSHSVVQQCQRALVKEELRRHGKTVTTYMALKRDVRQFVLELERADHPRIKEMKANFEQKQGQLFQEGLPTRGWLTYWDDMLKDGEWADDTFVQAVAFFLNLDIFLVPADSATYTQVFHPISGDIGSDRVGSPGRPTLLIGYISDQHYQSLLLLEEEPSVSGCPTPQAVDETLRRAFSALQLELFKKSRQVDCIFLIIFNDFTLKCEQMSPNLPSLQYLSIFRHRHQLTNPSKIPLYPSMEEIRCLHDFELNFKKTFLSIIKECCEIFS